MKPRKTLIDETQELRDAWAAFVLAVKWAALRDLVRVRRVYRRIRS